MQISEDGKTIKKVITHQGPGKRSSKTIIINRNDEGKDVRVEQIVSGDSGVTASWISSDVEINLDSILKDRLKNEKINASFNYALVSEVDSEVQVFSATTGLDSLDEAKAVTYRFESEDGQGPPMKFIVDLEKQKVGMPIKLGMMTGLSVLFSGFLVWAFWYTLRGLIRQKKTAELKADLLHNFTHEFKTPLSTISLAADSLKLEKVKTSGTEIDNYANIIKKENKRLLIHVDHMLTLAQAEKGEVVLNKSEVHMPDLLHELVQSFELAIQDHQAEVKVDGDTTNLMADRSQLFSAIGNVLDNALKYGGSENKAPQITVSGTQSTNQYTIAIKDDGPGMDKETLAHAFDNFYRTGSGAGKRIKGHGLGLSYTKTIVEAHGGSVHLRSEKGLGTLVEIKLPAHG